MTPVLKKKLKNIKLLALDFDGTLTLGAYVIFNQDGVESVVCSRRDSLGVDMVKKAGVEVVVISKETNPVVAARCKKMGIKCWHGVKTGQNKLEILQSYARERKLDAQLICYGGDDVTDIPSIKWSGFGFTVADGHNLCRKAAQYTTKQPGGAGAVREICEMILEAKGRSPKL